MMYRLSLLALAGLAVAQNAPGITTNPGGAIPAGIAQPNITGFQNAVVLPARGGYAICVSGTIPVQASARNINLNFATPANQSQVTETFVDLISAGSTLQQRVMGGYRNVSGTYNIGGTLCYPANGTTSSTIQILTHGIGFDRYYWDFAPGYSYADYAAIEGYATFFYDRLGVGMSSKPDPIQEIQTPLEVAIKTELIRQLRAGKFGGRAWSKVVAVGHSFGSIITQAITVANPALVDAAVLTGFTSDTSGQPVFIAANNLAIASQDQPYRFAALSNAFLVAASAISNQIAFFKAPNFDPMMLALADATKGTVTFGELFTLASLVGPAPLYTKPVAIVNGANDIPFCLGNCSFPMDKTTATRSLLYPNARNLTSQIYLAPVTGHGINLHYRSTAAYQFIQNFVKAAGL